MVPPLGRAAPRAGLGVPREGFPRLSPCTRHRTLRCHACTSASPHRPRPALRHFAVVLRERRRRGSPAHLGAAASRHWPADDRSATRLHRRHARLLAQRLGRPLCGEPHRRRLCGRGGDGQRRLCLACPGLGRGPGMAFCGGTCARRSVSARNEAGGELGTSAGGGCAGVAGRHVDPGHGAAARRAHARFRLGLASHAAGVLAPRAAGGGNDLLARGRPASPPPCRCAEAAPG